MAKTTLPKVRDHVEVYWPDDDKYYAGRVISFNKGTGKHRVKYTDGEIECLNLKKELWRPAGTTLATPAAPTETTEPNEAVAQVGLTPVTSEYLGAILRSAARKGRVVKNRTLMHKKKYARKSPVYVVPIARKSTLLKCSNCIRLSSTRVLIARVATKWLRDETRRPKSPVHASMQELWVKMSADLCVQYVNGWLDLHSRGRAALLENSCDSDKELSWMLEMSASAYELGLQNYGSWGQPLTPIERVIEKDIMSAVAERFTYATQEKSLKLTPSAVRPTTAPANQSSNLHKFVQA